MADDSKVWGLIANLFGPLGGVVAYLVRKDDAFVKFHAVQSVIFGIVLWIITMFTFGLGGILGLVYLFLAWKAWQGEKYMLPVLGEYAEKYSKQ